VAVSDKDSRRPFPHSRKLEDSQLTAACHSQKCAFTRSGKMWCCPTRYAKSHRILGFRFSKLITGTQPAPPSQTWPNLQVIGLGQGDGLAYQAAWQDETGSWHSGDQLPGQTTRFSQLVSLSDTVNGEAAFQVLGLGQEDGFVYLAGWLDSSGNWHTGQLPRGALRERTQLNQRDPRGFCSAGQGAQSNGPAHEGASNNAEGNCSFKGRCKNAVSFFSSQSYCHYQFRLP
jgi:hypothetical protein